MVNFRRGALALALLGAISVQQAAAQRRDSTGLEAPRTQAAQSPERPAPLLDVPINRAEYRLGPGDLLELGIFGSLNDHYTLPVTPEGTVVIPDIGVARVLGVDLDEAERRVRALVLRLYRDVEVRLSLSRVRTFKVFVVGNVPEPGVSSATAVTRVSEVVPPVGDAGVVRRNITIRRASGDSISVDLVRFLQSGDLSANPTLLEGDALVVPVVVETIQAFGRVAFPGVYEFRRGETLADFLRVTNGGGDFPANAADSIRFTRFDRAGAREVTLLSREEALGARGRALAMRPFDAVFVPEVANFRQQKVAHVVGQVMRPGTYPIRPDTTTVRDLVEMAGGFTANASLATASLQRQPVAGIATPQALNLAPDSALSPQERQVRSLAARSEQSLVVIDFEQAFLNGDESQNQVLQAGDVLTIPERRDEVVLVGAVLRPGIVEYRPGLTFDDYIRLAGGYSRNANRRDVSIIRAGYGNEVQARDVWYPRPGDRIIVPFRPHRTVLQQVTLVTGVVSTIASALLAILATRQLF